LLTALSAFPALSCHASGLEVLGLGAEDVSIVVSFKAMTAPMTRLNSVRSGFAISLAVAIRELAP
jgi:hypothetical protein